jgi:hypothetical protein
VAAALIIWVMGSTVFFPESKWFQAVVFTYFAVFALLSGYLVHGVKKPRHLLVILLDGLVPILPLHHGHWRREEERQRSGATQGLR